MHYAEFTAGIDDENRRADRVLRKFLPETPLSRIYACLRTGLIKINGVKIKPDTRIRSGDILQIAPFLFDTCKPPVNKLNANTAETSFGFDSVFQNDHLLIINKPYDIPVHGGKNPEKTVAFWALQLKSTENQSLSFTPAPLHQLDRKTTGLLVISKSIRGAQWFSNALQNHMLVKIYVGIVHGHLQKTMLWSNRLEKMEKLDGFCTVGETETGKEAFTNAEPLALGDYAGEKVTLVAFTIYTGRTHQIRAQSAINGFPLVGDTAYGGRKILHKIPNQTEKRDFFLHASQLLFPSDNPLMVPHKIFCAQDSIFSATCKFCLLEHDISPYNG